VSGRRKKKSAEVGPGTGDTLRGSETLGTKEKSELTKGDRDTK